MTTKQPSLVPLIPVDQLPEWIDILGVPRELSAEQTAGLYNLGLVFKDPKMYEVYIQEPLGHPSPVDVSRQKSNGNLDDESKEDRGRDSSLINEKKQRRSERLQDVGHDGGDEHTRRTSRDASPAPSSSATTVTGVTPCHMQPAAGPLTVRGNGLGSSRHAGNNSSVSNNRVTKANNGNHDETPSLVNNDDKAKQGGKPDTGGDTAADDSKKKPLVGLHPRLPSPVARKDTPPSNPYPAVYYPAPPAPAPSHLARHPAELLRQAFAASNSSQKPQNNGSGGTRFCRHWCHHGRCRFGQECHFLHFMPNTPEDLRAVGLATRPDWWRRLPKHVKLSLEAGAIAGILGPAGVNGHHLGSANMNLNMIGGGPLGIGMAGMSSLLGGRRGGVAAGWLPNHAGVIGGGPAGHYPYGLPPGYVGRDSPASPLEVEEHGEEQRHQCHHHPDHPSPPTHQERKSASGHNHDQSKHRIRQKDTRALSLPSSSSSPSANRKHSTDDDSQHGLAGGAVRSKKKKPSSSHGAVAATEDTSCAKTIKTEDKEIVPKEEDLLLEY